MYVRRVILGNVKGFENLDFELSRPDGTYAGWTVFTGDNGSGKSTLLKAIAIGLVGRDVARSLQPNFRGWINGGAFPAEASIQLEVVRTPVDDEFTLRGAQPSEMFPVRLALEPGLKDISIKAEVPAKKSKKYQTPERTIWSTSASGWFSCGYGPFRRVFGASSEATQIMVSPATARFATMFQEAASLLQADQWIRELHYKAIEDKLRPIPDKVPEQLILDALLGMLGDAFMPTHLELEGVDSDGVWLKDAVGNRLAWSDMSDGYRAALALLIDIFRHLVTTYGPGNLVERDGVDGRIRVIRSGVVLIDEIDAHLHPAWQQTIGFWLKEHFPNIQFLVTTHSPIICQAADPHGLFVLPEPGSGAAPHRLTVDEYNLVIASRPDTILTSDAFGLQNTRSPRAVEARAKLARIASKQSAGGKLTPGEKSQWKELSLFQTDEEL